MTRLSFRVTGMVVQNDGAFFMTFLQKSLMNMYEILIFPT